MPAGRTFSPGEHVRPDDLWQFRVTNDLLMEQRGRWALQAVVVYQELENGAASNSRVRWLSVGARPVRRLGRFASIAVEAGWDHTKQGDLPSGSLFKVTVAPQITPALKFLSRPSLRAFVTWAHWSDTFRGQIAPPPTRTPCAVSPSEFNWRAGGRPGSRKRRGHGTGPRHHLPSRLPPRRARRAGVGVAATGRGRFI